MLNIQIKNLFDDKKSYEVVRELRWSEGVTCPTCKLKNIKKRGFHEVHINTMEGFWSLLRSWSRPHRGILQEKLPCYLAFFEFIHNVRRRGKALLHALLAILIAT